MSQHVGSNKVQSIINCHNVAEADVVLLAVPYDGTSSFGKGADKGPAAIKRCLDRQIEFRNRRTGTTPVERLKIAYESLPVNQASCQSDFVSPEEMVKMVNATYLTLLDRGQFAVLLGGEHSVSIGVWESLKNRFNRESVTVVQVDAHLDLRDDDSDYADEPHGHLAHSCVMRRAAECGFSIVSVGIRAYSQNEKDYGGSLVEAGRLVVFEHYGGSLDVGAVVRSVKTPFVYLTLDVDGIDPAHMPATGTPVQGGLGWEETQQLIQALFTSRHNVIGADLVEVAPRVGDSLTEYGAAQMVYDMIAYRAEKA